jgi:mannosyl-3-phosphoglycerate phosphatase
MTGIYNGMDQKIIIFTDLDGTLLDSDYSFKKALPALRVIKENNISLVLCSSKTRSEIECCRKKLGNEDPFISENGGGIFLPKKYFESRIRGSGFRIEVEGSYFVIKLGADYSELRDAVKKLRAEGFDVKGFGDMSAKEVSELTGLKIADARMARKRDFDEPFVLYGNDKNEAKLKQSIKAKGLNYTQGEFFHIMGDSDKGKAVDIVKNLFAGKSGKTVTAAFGDSPNDVEMLLNVDYAVVVQKKDGSYNQQIIRKVKDCIKADGIGPEGWNRAVIEFLNDL